MSSNDIHSISFMLDFDNLIIDLMLPPLFTPYMYLQNGLTITIKDSENCQKAKNGTLGHMSRERD